MKSLKRMSVLLVFALICGLCWSKEQLEIYTVVKGDTLFSIAKTFYNDTSQWGKIYSYNKFINDPWWIFPGDELIIPVEVAEEPAAVAEKKPEAVPQPEQQLAVSTPVVSRESVAQSSVPAVQQPVVQSSVAVTDCGVENYEHFFVTGKNWQFDGYITGDEEKKVMISQCDKVFVNLKEASKIKPRTRMTIYRKDRADREPGTGDGYIIRKVGVFEVKTKLSEKMLAGEIIMAAEPVMVGDIVKICK